MNKESKRKSVCVYMLYIYIYPFVCNTHPAWNALVKKTDVDQNLMILLHQTGITRAIAVAPVRTILKRPPSPSPFSLCPQSSPPPPHGPTSPRSRSRAAAAARGINTHGSGLLLPLLWRRRRRWQSRLLLLFFFPKKIYLYTHYAYDDDDDIILSTRERKRKTSLIIMSNNNNKQEASGAEILNAKCASLCFLSSSSSSCLAIIIYYWIANTTREPFTKCYTAYFARVREGLPCWLSCVCWSWVYLDERERALLTHPVWDLFFKRCWALKII